MLLQRDHRPQLSLTAEKETLRMLLTCGAARFSRIFDERLMKGMDRLIVNCPDNFLKERTSSHLRSLMLAQFFLQSRIEAALKSDKNQKQIFLRLFRHHSRICAAVASSNQQGFQRDQFLKMINTHLPGIFEEPGSFYLWHHPELPYYFWYIELHKLRGKEPSVADLRKIQKILQEQLLASPTLTPALFWPYNKEESFRQIQLLRQEMTSKKDLPHISIHFQEQHPSSIEFFIHLVRPKPTEPLEQSLKSLPDSIHYLRYFHIVNKIPFPIEIDGFSINIPSHLFDIQDSINLLYARRYAAKLIETVIGPFRDYNGGLLAKQQQHFEAIRVHLETKIPYFDLFAERLFYALHPVETWLLLSLNEAEELFAAFSELIQEKNGFGLRRRSNSFAIIKTANGIDKNILNFNNIDFESASYAQIILGGFRYLCLLGPAANLVEKIFQNISIEQRKTLRLVFQEGEPPSLNPHCSSSDMRCRILNKLLFEGLTRLNEQGIVEFAGATQMTVSPDGLLYTFKIRPSCWSNGESVTSFDYAASLQWALHAHLSHPERLYAIKNARAYKENRCTARELGIRAPDTDTLQIELEHPDDNFLRKLSQPFFFPMFGALKEPKWFNGPYLVSEQTKEGLILERNPYFWDQKRACFEQINIQWIKEIETIFELYKNGQIDWVGEPMSILSLPHIQKLSLEDQLKKQSARRRFLIYFNTHHPLLSSRLIRRSLSLAIDRSHICREIFPDSDPVYPEQPNIPEAIRLFKKGLEESGAGLTPLTFTFSHQTRREPLAKYLQTTWQNNLGIPINLEGLEWNEFRSRLEKRSFDMCVTIQNTSNENDIEFFQRFENTSSWNFSQWSHAGYRELIANAKESNQINWQTAAEKILNEEAPFAPLFNYAHFYAHHPLLEHFCLDAEGCVDFSGSRFKQESCL